MALAKMMLLPLVSSVAPPDWKVMVRADGSKTPPNCNPPPLNDNALPEPRLLRLAALIKPPLKLRALLKLLEAVSVSVPEPVLVSDPAPERAPL